MVLALAGDSTTTRVPPVPALEARFAGASAVSGAGSAPFAGAFAGAAPGFFAFTFAAALAFGFVSPGSSTFFALLAIGSNPLSRTPQKVPARPLLAQALELQGQQSRRRRARFQPHLARQIVGMARVRPKGRPEPSRVAGGRDRARQLELPRRRPGPDPQ